MAFLCIDVGGTKTLLGVGNSEFSSVEKIQTENFLNDIGKSIGEFLEGTDRQKTDIETIAVAVAGTLDREKGVFYPPNIESMEEVQIKKPLEEIADVEIVNDCTAAVAGEYFYGESSENMVYVTISTGIGAGVVIDGNVVEGWKGNFAEVGHLKVDNQGVNCGCGGKDHWEAYCSGDNLPKMAEKLFNADYSNAVEVFEAYEDGDEKASEVIEKMKQLNARGITEVVTAYNPELVSLGGALPLNHPDIMLEGIEEKIEELSINSAPEIKICSLKERAVIHGLRAVCNGKFKTGT